MLINRVIILGLFLLGFYGLVVQKNLVKKVFSLAIQNSAVVLLFILEGSTLGSYAPLLTDSNNNSYVDPIPQALMLTAIVVGVCVTALALALVFRLYKLYGTLDVEVIQQRVKHE